jgi:Mg-chelatase subunit ChlD
MDRSTSLAAAVLLALGLAATGLFASSLFDTAHAAAVGPCTDVQIIGLRGSSEQLVGGEHDMGSLLGPLADQIAERASGAATVSFYGVPYPAAGANVGTVIDGEYTASKQAGSAMLHDYLKDEIASCPNTKLVVMGYSQGAHAAGDQLAVEPASVTDHVKAFLMFGDPLFNADLSYGWGSFDPRSHGLAGKRLQAEFNSWSSRVFSFCNQDDIVCQGVYFHHGTETHAQSVYLANYGAVAAGLVRRQLGLPNPASSHTPLDIAFVIDSTGSMSSSINGVEQAAQNIAADLEAKGSDFRIGLVDYKDTDQGDAYAASVDLDMTNDVSAFSNAVSSLGAFGGGDTPEAVYSGVMTAITQLHWRPIPRKVIIVMGDAPAKDPEPVTGYTRADVLAAARNLDPAAVFPVAVGTGPIDTFQPLAAGSGGQLFQADDPSGVSAEITAAVDKAAVPLYVGLTAGTPARPGAPVPFSAANSYYDSGDITSYAWDFNGDGTIDATTAENRATHVYDSPFSGVATVTATTNDGHSATATATVDIRTDAPVSPGAPTALNATAGSDQHSIRLAWQPPADLGGGALDGYSVEIDDAVTGQPVRVFTTAPDVTAPPPATGLTAGGYIVSVAALGEGGVGEAVSKRIDLAPVSVPWPKPKHRRGAARLRIARAHVRRGKLDVLAKIATRATGNVRVKYRVGALTISFRASVSKGTIRVNRKLSRRQRTGGGLLTLTYGGNAYVQPGQARVRVR